MTFQEYQALFEEIVKSDNPPPPYDNPDYLEYTRLNYSWMNRWLKTLQLEECLVKVLRGLTKGQHWIIIVEPWCGDVAHSLPFLIRLAEQSPLITYELQLRDREPYLIDSYLTLPGEPKAFPSSLPAMRLATTCLPGVRDPKPPSS